MDPLSPAPRSLPAQLAEVLLHGTRYVFPHTHLHVCIDLRRSWTRDRIEEAVAAVIRDHPVLGCRYEPSWWRDRWVPCDGGPGDLVHTESVEREDLAAATLRQVRRLMDHTATPTFRLARIEHEGGCRLLVTLHHMTGDGGAVKAVANSVAAHLQGVDPHPPPCPDRSVLAPARFLRLGDLPALLAELAREALQPLSILRVHRLSRVFQAGAGQSEPQWRSIVLSGSRADGFVAACRRSGATINDGLVAAVARLATRYSESGPAAASYTIDLRRYIRPPSARVTNLHGVRLLVLPRDRLAGPREAVLEVSHRIGEHKRRLPGLSYTLLPALLLGWLPHGILRRAGRVVLGNLIAYMNRALALTNIGALDEALAPFGEDALEASIIGPFVHGFRFPIVTATGFRGSLTLHVGSTGTISEDALEGYARDLADLLDEAAEEDR